MADKFYLVAPAGKDLSWSQTVALAAGDSAAFSIPGSMNIAGVLGVTVASSGAWNAKYAVDDSEGDGQSVGASKDLASGTATAQALVPVGATSLIVACTAGSISVALAYSFTEYSARHVPSGGSDGKFLKYGANGPEWVSSTPIGAENADGLPDGAVKGITTLAGKAAADAIGAATGADTQAKLKAVIGAASETNAGVVEEATVPEVVTGTDGERVLSVANLRTALASMGMWLEKRTVVPDLNTPAYANESWSGGSSSAVDGWSVSNATLTYGTGTVIITATGSGTGRRMERSTTLTRGAIIGIMVRKKAVTGTAYVGYRRTSDSSYNLTAFAIPLSEVDTWVLRFFVLQEGADRLLISPIATAAGASEAIEVRWFYAGSIGTYGYLDGSLSEAGSRAANLIGDQPGIPSWATGTITATDQPTATKGDTIGGKKYTYVTTLTASPGVEGEVLIGTDKEDTLENLDLAISEAGRTSNGTKYWAAEVHPTVSSAHTVGAASISLTSKLPDEFGNQLTIVCESGTNHTASGAVFAGGVSNVARKLLSLLTNIIAGGGTRPAAAMLDIVNTALIGYETTVDVVSGGTLTLPAGGTWLWNVYGYGATISSAKRGSSAGGTTLTVAGANSAVGYRRYA